MLVLFTARNSREMDRKDAQIHENTTRETYVRTHTYTRVPGAVLQRDGRPASRPYIGKLLPMTTLYAPSLLSTCRLFGHLSHPSRRAPVIDL